ncbi:MAG: hypothetical protein VX730_08120 [Pseudomonadota bacterium]|nr:hypothetical protein [Pseudomonadota bacterium]
MGETLGYISLILYVVALLFHKPRHSFICFIIANLFFIAQCIVSEMYVAVMGPIGLTALTVFILNVKKKNWTAYVKGYATFTVCVGVYFASSVSEYIVVSAMCIDALSRLGRDHFYLFRTLSSLGNILWFTSFYIEGVTSIMLMSALMVSLNVIYMVRHALRDEVLFKQKVNE